MNTYKPNDTIDIYEIENNFYLRSHPSRLAKLTAHYELYRKIIDLPGAVVEMGVYKGASLMRFATFRDILENTYSRPIIGFDAFGTFPKSEVLGEKDIEFIEKFEKIGGQGISKNDLNKFLDEKGFRNIQLIEGNIFTTVPKFINDNPMQKISLLHLDLDVYEPTDFVLSKLISHMVAGAIVVFDDYSVVEGATRAADEICRKFDFKMKKLSNYNVPSYFTVI